MAAGVRECRLERALQELGRLLEDRMLQVIDDETTKAIDLYGWERWPE